MHHPNHGVLRRLVDDPAGVADADRAHVADCPQCLDALVTVREDAVREATVRQDAVREHAVVVPEAPRADGAGRVRATLRRPVVALLAVAVVLTGAGTAAAQGWLPIFRTEQVAAVDLSGADLLALPDLSAYGDLVVDGDDEVQEVPDAATAAARTGLDVPQVTDLPRGVVGEPVHGVGGEVTATFTFDADRAAQSAGAAVDAGETPSPPPGLDGSQVRLMAGPGVVQVWSQPSGVPSLVVGRAVAPTASSTGVSFETARDHLLSLPGLPDDVAAQLRTFTADGATLPLPVPADRIATSSADVNGVTATVLATHDRTLAAVVWVDDGVVTAVAGPLGSDEVLAVARGLRG